MKPLKHLYISIQTGKLLPVEAASPREKVSAEFAIALYERFREENFEGKDVIAALSMMLANIAVNFAIPTDDETLDSKEMNKFQAQFHKEIYEMACLFSTQATQAVTIRPPHHPLMISSTRRWNPERIFV